MNTIIYFSPTGNTLHLAKELKNNLNVSNESFLELDQIDVTKVQKNENLILMFSIHAFNAPRTVTRFVKNLASDLFKKVYIIAVGCNTSWVNDAAGSSIIKILEKKGYEVLLSDVVAMPLTFVMSFPDDVIEKSISDSTKRMSDIQELVASNEKTDKKVKFKSKVIHKFGKIEDFAARFFGLELHAKKTCTSCGICWNRCPESNIKPNKKNMPKFGLKCMMCMRCVYECPEEAITPYMSKFLIHKNHYNLNNHLNKIEPDTK